MALKAKTPPPLNEAPSQQNPSLSEERILRVNPEVDRRLDGFMQANSKLTDYYTNLVKEHPERAVRSFMLGKMFKHEAERAWSAAKPHRPRNGLISNPLR